VALQWTSALAIGVPSIDSRHRELFRRVDRLLDAMIRGDRSEALQLLEFLKGYAVEQAAAEERLMAEIGYPAQDREAHLAEHRAFAASVAELEALARESGASAGLTMRVGQRAVTWLRDHVYLADVALGQFVRAHGRGGSVPGAAS
jgi:hemerythrin